MPGDTQAPETAATDDRDRVLTALDAVARNAESGIGVREMAASSHMSRSTAHRTLTTLHERGVLRQIPGGRYGPGVVLASWARHVLRHNVLLSAGQSALRQLSSRTGETVLLVAYSRMRNEAFVLDSCESTRPVRYRLPIGSRTPLHAGSAGKAIAAYLEPDRVKELELVTLTARTPTDRDALLDHLDRARELGYVCTEGERFDEAAGIAAPFFLDGLVAGSFNITIPRYRLDDDIAEHAAPLVAAARELTVALAVQALPRPARRPGVVGGPGAGTTNRVIDPILSLLDALARGHPGGLTRDEVAALAATSNVDQVLRRLTAMEVAHLRPDQRYQPGLRLMLWSRLLREYTDIGHIARDVLVDLVDELDETASVVVHDRSRHTATVVASHRCRQPIQYVLADGTTAPLHAGAAGRAILAHLDEPVRQRIVADATTTDTANADAELTDRELETIRSRGYAVSKQERLSDAACLAAPYFADDVVEGAVAIMVPEYRLSPENTARYGPAVRAAAERVTALLSTGPAGSFVAEGLSRSAR